MKKTVSSIFAALITVLCCQSALADDAFREDYPKRYVVEKGDTLWDISSRFLKTPWLWPEIWHVNTQIANPHLIFPGDVISLVYIDGKPRLTVERTVKLMPSSDEKLKPRIRVSPIASAIPAIPLDQINSWLLRNRVVEPGVLKASPYVVGGQEKRLLLGSGDTLYGRGEFAANVPSYGLYRIGENYVDPDTEEVLGVQALDVGGANMRALDADISTMSVTRSTGDIRVGDRILPVEQRRIQPTFFPSEPDNTIEGKIINVEGGMTQVGMLSVIAINQGERDKLEPGNILAIYKRGEKITDQLAEKRSDRKVTLPDVRSGILMVFQTFEKMSLALVLKADRGIRVGDHVRNP